MATCFDFPWYVGFFNIETLERLMEFSFIYEDVGTSVNESLVERFTAHEAALWWFHHVNRQRSLAEVAVTDSIGNSLPDEGKVAHWAAEKAKCIAFWDEHGVECLCEQQ
jgi:hypothetical protein